MNATNEAATNPQSPDLAATARSQLALKEVSQSRAALRRVKKGSLRTAARLVGQATFVYGVFLVASRLVQGLRLPLPASLAGVLLLLLLLIVRVVTPKQMQELSDLTSAHLPFFFIPLVVMGLLSWGDVLVQSWVVLTAALLGSAVVGIAASGLSAQAVHAFRKKGGVRRCKP